ncbi:hypothetical protein [Kitasatospora sp. NBC_01266]|uniref:hypothetical protein n=1 Tax=Kitasatospora sp. NBC_01266 TaxID=2903572 RepID=UPI002E328168|nr:hypothetical protein [Kitasatospora sp. NBC_01266]
MTPYQIMASENLRALGHRLDVAAKQGADTDVLDPLLAAMRQVHDGIDGHLAAELGLPPRRATAAPCCVRQPTPAPLLVRQLTRAA